MGSSRMRILTPGTSRGTLAVLDAGQRILKGVSVTLPVEEEDEEEAVGTDEVEGAGPGGSDGGGPAGAEEASIACSRNPSWKGRRRNRDSGCF